MSFEKEIKARLLHSFSMWEAIDVGRDSSGGVTEYSWKQ